MNPGKVTSPLERHLRAVVRWLLPGRVLGVLQRLEARLKTKRFPRLYNVNGADESRASMRALLVYKVRPFMTAPDSAWFLVHQNRRQCIQIARVLGELGYVVDVVDINDKI
jgi:hypothetical protein